MTYVPIVPTPPTPPSPRTRELADLLSRVIREYETHHPSVTGPEIRQALSLAAAGSKGASDAARLLVKVLVAGLAVLGAVLFFGLRIAGETGGNAFPVVAVAIAVLLLLGLLVAVKGMGR